MNILDKIAILFYYGLLIPAQATAITTVFCNSPIGVRNYIEAEEFAQGDDGYSGIYPKFIFDKKEPKRLHLLFSATQQFGKTHNDEFQKATVIRNSENEITAIERKKNEIWMYSLFRKEGIGYFTRHSQSSLFSSPHGTTFYSKCKFGN